MSTKRERYKDGNVVWACRGFMEYPNVYVRFIHDGSLEIYGYADSSGDYLGDLKVDRRTARLLARRINQALDDWQVAR